MKTEATGDPKRRPTCVYGAREKVEAVLALWSGRRSPAALTKALQVPWGLLNTWEQRALGGMLTALDPAWKRAETETPSLPVRVERLFSQTLNPAAAAPTAEH